MKASVWTPERVETLKSLWAQRYSAAEIARTLASGLTRCAVLGKVHRLDLPTHAAPPKLHRAPARSRIARTAKHPVKRAIEAPPPLNIAFLDLQPRHCRYPVNGGPPFLFCGQTKQTGSSYCSRHHALTHDGFPNPNTSERERRVTGACHADPLLERQKSEEEALPAPPPLRDEAA